MLDDKTLEQGTSQEELTGEVSKKEPNEEVSSGKGAVSEEKSEEDITAEVKAAADAVEAYKATEAYQKEIQSAKDKSIAQEIKPYKEKISELEKSIAEKEIAFKEAQETEKWREEGISEEVIKSFQAARRELLQLEGATRASMEKHNEELKELHASKLAKEHSVSVKDLLGCKTREEMDTKVLRLVAQAKDAEVERLKAEKKAIEEKAAKSQKIDSGTSSGAGINLASMTPDEILKQGFKDLKRKTGG